MVRSGYLHESMDGQGRKLSLTQVSESAADESINEGYLEMRQRDTNGTHQGAYYPSGPSVDPQDYRRGPGESRWHYYGRRLFAKRPVESLVKEAQDAGMNQTLKIWDLLAIGIGAIIGNGIFVLSGHAAGVNSGPGIVLSFMIAGLTAFLAALSYSEMASMIPVAGSTYTYVYATMGEFIAWTIGWDLILEYMVGAATVAVGFSGYLVSFFSLCGVKLGESWTAPPLNFTESNGTSQFHRNEGAYFNVPGFIIILAITFLLTIGVRESAYVNNVIVFIKIVVILFFVFGCAKFVDSAHNLTPFIPPATNDWHFYGAGGVFAGATKVFYAYVGFDAVSTAAQETQRPGRNLPIGIIGSLTICAVLYIIAAVVMVGVVNYVKLANDPVPVLTAVLSTKQQWLAVLVSIGAMAALASVMLTLLLAQPRIFYSMGRDGLFPKQIGKIHPKFKTPYIPTIISGAFAAILGGTLPVDLLGNMTSAGTLLAYFLVHVGIIVLRFTRPDIDRRFKIPGDYCNLWLIVPILGMITSILLICTAETTTIWRVVIWCGIGWILYFTYGFWHSRLNNSPEEAIFPD